MEKDSIPDDATVIILKEVRGTLTVALLEGSDERAAQAARQMVSDSVIGSNERARLRKLSVVPS